MTDAIPVILLLHGEDEFAIARFLADLKGKLGDPGLLELNTNLLDERSFNPDELPGFTGALPFLAERRLVIVKGPAEKLKGKVVQEKFLGTLEKYRQPPFWC